MEYLVEAMLLLEYHCIMFEPFMGGEALVGARGVLRFGVMGSGDWEAEVRRDGSS